MTVTVVVLLEIVNVEFGHQQRAVFARRHGVQVIVGILERPEIVHAGQRIVQRQHAQLLALEPMGACAVLL